MTEPHPTLRVVIVEEDGYLVAQCLELDIAAHGPTREAAITELGRAYVRHILVARHLGVPPFSELSPAPEQFWKLWRQRCEAGEQPVSHAVPRFTVVPRTGNDQTPLAQPELLCA